MKAASVWLEGYYPPTIDDFASWQHEWSMGPNAEPDWVWIQGDYYTEADAQRVLRDKPWGTCESNGGVPAAGASGEET